MIFIPRWGDHAGRAKRRHGITEAQIAQTWTFGIVEQQPLDNCWRIIGKEITLIVDEEEGFIVTMYPNKHRDRFTGKMSASCERRGITRLTNL